MQNKNLDLIVLNARDEGAGFRHDTNKNCIIDKENNKYESYPKIERRSSLGYYEFDSQKNT
ncbi:MAG: hypothetical protein IPN94_00115 [Sphingobacteriales bacterium]|nr:hypothetical protein [Sphingobacteriales bacterium]